MTPIIESHTIGPATHLMMAMTTREHKAAVANPTANTGHVLIVSSTMSCPI